MKKFFVTFILFFAGLAFAQNSYYQNIDVNKTTLVQDLHNLIYPHTKVTYDNYDETNIANFASWPTSTGNRTVRCVYSGVTYTYTPPFKWYGTTGVATDSGFSREHTWCHTWMPSNPADSPERLEYCDQHHIFPTNQKYANAIRNDHQLGVVANPTKVFGECKYGPSVTGNWNFEPRDSHKGDAARALLYMAVCYNGEGGYNWTFRQLNKRLKSINEDTVDVSLLIKWAKQDPPDAWEISRNDYIYSIQGNRNPFVDHPEYLDYINFYDLIYKSNNLAAEPTNYLQSLSVSNIGDNSFQLNWAQADAGAKAPDGYLIVIKTTNNFSAPVDGNTYNDDLDISDGIIYANVAYGSTNNLTISNLASASSYYVKVYSYSGTGPSRNYKTDGSIPYVSAITTGTLAWPTNYPTNFKVLSFNSYSATLNWDDSQGAIIPSGYLILVNTTNLFTAPDNSNPPSQDADITDGSATIYIPYSDVNYYTINNLQNNTNYYFQIYPYSGINQKIFKKDGTIPTLSIKTKVTTSDIIISQYVDGNGSEKYLELYNGTGNEVDLSNYKLRLYQDGASSPTYDIQLSGVFQDNSTIVFKNAAATSYTGDTKISNICNFDGNDAIAIYNIANDKLVDIFGVIGTNPGSNGWKYLSSYYTKNMTLIRKPYITSGVQINPTGSGDNSFTTMGIEWNFSSASDLSNLGTHSFNSASNVLILDDYDGASNQLMEIGQLLQAYIFVIL